MTHQTHPTTEILQCVSGVVDNATRDTKVRSAEYFETTARATAIAMGHAENLQMAPQPNQ